MPGLPWRPIITYGSAPTVITLTYPQRLWDYASMLVGGSRKSSAGIPESFVIRNDELANITLRVHDCEYLAVRAWILDAMLGNTFTFQFDALDVDSVFTCYLDSPTLADGYKPKRDPNWPNMWIVPLSIRAVNRVPIFYSFGQACVIDTTSVAPLDWIISHLDASALPNGSGRKILSLTPVAPIFPPDGVTDPSALDGSNFMPAGWDAAGLYRTIDPLQEWVTRPLSAGFIIPSIGQMGGSTTGSPVVDWYAQHAVLKLSYMRSGVVVAASDEVIFTYGWLGGGGITDGDFSSLGTIISLGDGNDQLLLQVWAEYSPKPGGDHSGRLSLSWGSVFGPLVTTRLYGTGNVTELP